MIAGQTALPVPLHLSAPRVSEVALPLVAGVVITLVAAVAPARRSTRVAPLEALRPDAVVPTRSTAGLVRIGFGLLLLATGGLGLLAAMTKSNLLIGVAGGLVTFLGVLALGPILIPALIRGIGATRRMLPPAWRGGVPADLSVANAVRNPRRTAATTSALLIGVTLVSVLTVGASSVSASSTAALDHNNPIDLTVTSSVSGNPGRAAADHGAISPDLVSQLRAIQGLTDVAVISGRSATIGKTPVTVAKADAAARAAVRDPRLAAMLAKGNATLPLDYGGRGVRRITLSSGGRWVTLPGAYGGLEGLVLISPAAMQTLGGASQPVAVWIKVTDGADSSSVMSHLQDVVSAAPGENLVISGGYVERVARDRALNMMLLISTGLLAMALIIALVGISNTLSLSVIERGREQALLRALGLTKGQLRAMLATEAVLMALVAAGLGVALGIGFGWAGTVTLMGQVTSQSAVLDVPWTRLGLIVLVALVAGLLASVLPGHNAARSSPAAALAEV